MRKEINLQIINTCCPKRLKADCLAQQYVEKEPMLIPTQNETLFGLAKPEYNAATEYAKIIANMLHQCELCKARAK